MKNLDLNSYGVQEMNAEEMIIAEGGGGFSVGDYLIGKAIDTIGTLFFGGGRRRTLAGLGDNGMVAAMMYN